MKSRLGVGTASQPASISASAYTKPSEKKPGREAHALSPAEQSLVAQLVADGLSIQEKFRPEPLYKRIGQGHYASNTVEEIRRAKDKSR